MDSAIYVLNAADFASFFMNQKESMATVHNKETALMLSLVEQLFSRWFQKYRQPNSEKLDYMAKMIENPYENSDLCSRNKRQL